MFGLLEHKNAFVVVTAAIAITTSFYIIWGPSNSKKKRKKGVKCPGLVNTGNSCFLNAVLQAMATCPTLVNWLNTVLLNSGDGGTRSKMLIYALQSILNVLNNEGNLEENEHYLPSEVLEALQARGWVIYPDQQDAHELFHVLTETLDEESTKYPSYLSLMDVKQLMDRECEYQRPEVARNRVDTLLPVLPCRDTDNPFKGLLASQLQCTACGFKNPVRYDKFDSLSLSLPPVSMNVMGRSIEDLLSGYVRPETVKDVECENCARRLKAAGSRSSSKSTFIKKLTIGKLPQCLCVQIQRTIWRNDGLPMKRHDYVTFDETLNMEPYVYHNKNHVKQVEMKMPFLPGLLGGRKDDGKAQSYGMISSASSKKKPVTSPKVQAPYSRPLNLLKAMHYNVIYNPRRGINVDPVISNTSKTTTTTPTPAKNLLYNQISETLPRTSSSADIERLAMAFSIEQNYSSVPKNAYTLTSVVQHMGDVFSGHFVTYRRAPSFEWERNFSMKWLYTSDTDVKRVKFEEVKDCTAYMLFYERTQLG